MTNECKECSETVKKFRCFRETIEVLNIEKINVQNEVKIVKENYDVLNAKNINLEKSITEKNNEVCKLKDQLTKFNENETSKLINDIKTLQKANEDYKSDIHFKEMYIKTLSDKDKSDQLLNKKLMMEVEDLKASNETLKVQTQCKNCISLTNIVKTLKANLKELQLTSENKDVRIKSLEEDIVNLKKNEIKLNDNYIKLQQQLDLKNNAIPSETHNYIKQIQLLKEINFSQRGQLRKTITKHCSICKETASIVFNCFNHKFDWNVRTAQEKAILNSYKNSKITILSHLQMSLIDEMVGDEELKKTLDNIKQILNEDDKSGRKQQPKRFNRQKSPSFDSTSNKCDSTNNTEIDCTNNKHIDEVVEEASCPIQTRITRSQHLKNSNLDKFPSLDSSSAKCDSTVNTEKSEDSLELNNKTKEKSNEDYSSDEKTHIEVALSFSQNEDVLPPKKYKKKGLSNKKKKSKKLSPKSIKKLVILTDINNDLSDHKKGSKKSETTLSKGISKSNNSSTKNKSTSKSNNVVATKKNINESDCENNNDESIMNSSCKRDNALETIVPINNNKLTNDTDIFKNVDIVNLNELIDSFTEDQLPSIHEIDQRNEQLEVINKSLEEGGKVLYPEDGSETNEFTITPVKGNGICLEIDGAIASSETIPTKHMNIERCDSTQSCISTEYLNLKSNPLIESSDNINFVPTASVCSENYIFKSKENDSIKVTSDKDCPIPITVLENTLTPDCFIILSDSDSEDNVVIKKESNVQSTSINPPSNTFCYPSVQPSHQFINPPVFPQIPNPFMNLPIFQQPQFFQTPVTNNSSNQRITENNCIILSDSESDNDCVVKKEKNLNQSDSPALNRANSTFYPYNGQSPFPVPPQFMNLPPGQTPYNYPIIMYAIYPPPNVLPVASDSSSNIINTSIQNSRGCDIDFNNTSFRVKKESILDSSKSQCVFNNSNNISVPELPILKNKEHLNNREESVVHVENSESHLDNVENNETNAHMEGNVPLEINLNKETTYDIRDNTISKDLIITNKIDEEVVSNNIFVAPVKSISTDKSISFNNNNLQQEVSLKKRKTSLAMQDTLKNMSKKSTGMKRVVEECVPTEISTQKLNVEIEKNKTSAKNSLISNMQNISDCISLSAKLPDNAKLDPQCNDASEKSLEQAKIDEIRSRTENAKEIIRKNLILKNSTQNQASNISKFVAENSAKNNKKTLSIIDKMKKTVQKQSNIMTLSKDIRPVKRTPIILERSTKQTLDSLKINNTSTDFISGNKRSRLDSEDVEKLPLKRFKQIEKKERPIKEQSRFMDVKTATLLNRKLDGNSVDLFHRLSTFINGKKVLEEVVERDNIYKTEVVKVFDSNVLIPINEARIKIDDEMKILSKMDFVKVIQEVLNVVKENSRGELLHEGSVAHTASLMILSLLKVKSGPYSVFCDMLKGMIAEYDGRVFINMFLVNINLLTWMKQTDMVVSFIVEIMAKNNVSTLLIARCLVQKVLNNIESAHYTSFLDMLKMIVIYEFSTTPNDGNKKLITTMPEIEQQFWFNGSNCTDFVPCTSLDSVISVVKKTMQEYETKNSKVNWNFLDRIITRKYQ